MAGNNAKSAAPGGKPAANTAENTNMHKLMAMGHDPKTQVSGGKKTPA